MKTNPQLEITVNTLFNRLTANNIQLSRAQIIQLGQKIKDKYVEKYHKLPEKVAVKIKTKHATDVLKTVAAYPEEFVPSMDKIIKNFVIGQHKAYTFHKTLKHG